MKSLRMLGFLFLFLIVLHFNVDAALNVDIEVKPTFVKGDVISFNYEIISTEDADIGYTPYVDCPEAIHPILGYRIATIKKNVPMTRTYEYVQVTEEIEPQTCVAYIQLISPFEQKFEKNFTIETSPRIVFRILTCKDLFCESESKVFVKNENIYFSSISDIFDIRTKAVLTLPDRTTKQLTLPTSIKAKQIGTYELEVIASKPGYKTITKKEQFGVIEQGANIPYLTDKSSKKINYSAIILITIIVLFVVFLIVIISVKIFKIIRRRRFGKIKGIKKLEKIKKGIDLKKLELKKGFQKELKEKERAFKKKERFLDKLLWRKKKARGKEHEALRRKLKHDRKLLSGKKLEIKKELGKKFETKRKLLEFKKTGLEKEKKVVRDKSQKEVRKYLKGKVNQEIRRLLLEGRMQLSSGNKLAARNTYRKIRKLHGSLKSSEKNKELHNKILIFHKRLTK